MGAVILPPMPAFYNRPKQIDDLVTHTLARVLDRLGLPHIAGPGMAGHAPARAAAAPARDRPAAPAAPVASRARSLHRAAGVQRGGESPAALAGDPPGPGADRAPLRGHLRRRRQPRPERRDRPRLPRAGSARAAGAPEGERGRDRGHRRGLQGGARAARGRHGRRSPERSARHSRDARPPRPVGRGDRLAREPGRGRFVGAAPLLAHRQPRAQPAERGDHPGQRLHLPRLPPRVPARPRALQGLPPVHPDAAQDAGLPGARGAGQPSAAAVRPVQVRHRQPRVRAPSWTCWWCAG